MNFHNFISDGSGWETVQNDLQFSNPHLEVFTSQVKTPTRSVPCHWTVAHRKGVAVIAPMTSNGEILLIRQERIPIRSSLWEFPAGQIEMKYGSDYDEKVLRDAAIRELREETGYELASDGKLIPLGHFFTSAGFTDEHSFLFIARAVVQSSKGHAHDSSEAITECQAFSQKQLREMIAENEIRDANTLCAYARMCAMGLL